MKSVNVSVLQARINHKTEEIRIVTLKSQSYNTVEDLSICRNIQRLDLSYNSISDADGLEKCKSIKWMNMCKNELTSVSFCSKLTSLSVLNLGHNHIQDISALGNLVNLKALILNDNCIEQVKCLDLMAHLNTLVLSRNSIRNIQVEHLSYLSKLQLSHNQMTEFPDIRFNTELKGISLNDNQIKTIPDGFISEGTRLEKVDLGNNRIKKVKNILVLTKLNRLSNFNLMGNQICENDGWVNKIVKTIPTLKILNSKPIHKLLEKSVKAPICTKEEPDKTDLSNEEHTTDTNTELSQSAKDGRVKKKKKKKSIEISETTEKTKFKRKLDEHQTETEKDEEQAPQTKPSKQIVDEDNTESDVTSKRKKKKHKKTGDSKTTTDPGQTHVHHHGIVPTKDPSSGVVKIKTVKRSKPDSSKVDIFTAFENSVGSGSISQW